MTFSCRPPIAVRSASYSSRSLLASPCAREFLVLFSQVKQFPAILSSTLTFAEGASLRSQPLQRFAPLATGRGLLLHLQRQPCIMASAEDTIIKEPFDMIKLSLDERVYVKCRYALRLGCAQAYRWCLPTGRSNFRLSHVDAMHCLRMRCCRTRACCAASDRVQS
jgi:hypothetical protein